MYQYIKKTSSFTLAIGLVSLLVGCAGVQPEVHGVGEMVSMEISTDNFRGIEIRGTLGVFNITYRHANEPTLVVRMQENLFQYLQVFVEDEILIAEPSRAFIADYDSVPWIYVYAPYLTSVTLGGVVNTHEWDTITTQHLEIDMGGVVNAQVAMDVEILDLAIAGVGDIGLTGSAQRAIISVAGTSDVLASGLQTASATIDMAGAGNVYIAVSETLIVSAFGVGRVRYIGEPVVYQTGVGIGVVEPYEP